jgi:membrane protein DedA with SNARE-associated domain
MLTLCLLAPGDLVILMAGYLYHIGDQPGQVIGVGTVRRLRLAAEPFC